MQITIFLIAINTPKLLQEKLKLDKNISVIGYAGSINNAYWLKIW